MITTRGLAILLISCAALAGPACAQNVSPCSQVDQTARQVWNIDLPRMVYGEARTPPPLYGGSHKVAFGTGNIVAVMVATRSFVSSHSEMTDHLFIVDISSGRILKQMDWPPRKGMDYPQLLAAAGGNFLVARDDTITLYSPDLEEIRSVSMPIRTALVSSPTDSVFGWFDPSTFSSPDGVRLTIFDSHTLKPTGVNFISRASIRSITGTSALGYERRPNDWSLVQLDASGNAITIYRVRPEDGIGPGRYLTSSTLTAGTRILDTDGHELFSGERFYSFLGMSHDGKSFALGQVINAPGDPPLIECTSVHLYSWNGHEAHLLSRIKAAGNHSDWVLSPDGHSLLAVDSSGIFMYGIDR